MALGSHPHSTPPVRRWPVPLSALSAVLLTPRSRRRDTLEVSLVEASKRDAGYGSPVSSGQRRAASNAIAGQHKAIRALRPESLDGDRGRGGLERLVDQAAEQITRFSAPEAFSASTLDAVIIDIRSQDARDLHGVIHGSLHIPRTVLEWRVAIDSPWRNIHLGGLDQRMILLCDHGYSSILAASNLVQLGFYRAGDVVGGFEAWKDNGLPIVRRRPRPSTASGLPGTDR